MKNLKIFFLAAVAVVAGLFTACSDDDFAAGPLADGAQVYFPNSVPAEYSIGDEETSITIPVNRIVTDEAQTVSILFDDPSGLFTVPAAVSFAAGESSVELVVTFDRTALEDGTEYPLAFLINDEENTTPYGNSQLNITVVPWPWEYLGTGLYRDDYLTAMFKGDSVEIEVEIYESKSKKGVYMIEEMFGWPFLTEFFGGSQAAIEAQVGLTYVPVNITINAQNPQQVFIGGQLSGIVDKDPDYGEYLIGSPQGVYGKLENKVITLPVQGLILQYQTGAMYANKNGLFRIMLPGAEITDYALAVEYDSMRVEADGETASAVINFAYGADVTAVKYIVAAGSVSDAQAAEYAAAIADGSAEDINEVGIDGSGSATEKFELSESGAYSVVAVAYDKAGQPLAGDYAVASFFFPGMGGAVAPECDVTVKLMPVSEFNPDLVAQYPEESSLAAMVEGTELAEVTLYINTTALIETINDGSAGLTWDEVMTNYGTKWGASQFQFLEANGYWGTVYYNRTPNTSYTLAVLAKNVYGKSALVMSTCSTAAPDYKGELVIGDYLMSCVTDNGGTPFESENLFTVDAASSTSVTDFLVTDFVFEDGGMWNGTYDPAASTFTLTSDDLNKWYLITLQGTDYAYKIASYVGEEGTGADPVVATVDSATKQLKGLQAGAEVEVVLGSVEGTAVTGILGAISVFDDTSTIEPYVEAASVSSMLKKKSNAASLTKVPYRAITLNDLKQAGRRALKSDIRTVEARMQSKLRTLSVNPVKCEPTAREFGARADFKIRENLRVK